MGGGAELRRALRSLCVNTEWKYAAFWKLNHRTRMVLTLEDAYYDKREQDDSPENSCDGKALDKFLDGHYSHDLLGLAVAKMSYRVYAFGEGIIGQVAVTGKHQWVFADKHIKDSSSFECNEGWQNQFSAGIRTIVIVAVVPHGVLQLGSLNKVIEDAKLVNHVRDIFLNLQDSVVEHIPSPIQYSMKNLVRLQDIPTNSLASEMIPDCLDKAIDKERPDIWLSMFPCIRKGRDNSTLYQKNAVEVVNGHGGLDLSTSGGDRSAQLHLPKSDTINPEHQKQVGMGVLNTTKCGGEISGCNDMRVASKPNFSSLSHGSAADSFNLYDNGLLVGKVGVDLTTYLSSGPVDSAVCESFKLKHTEFYEVGLTGIPESSELKFEKALEKLEFQADSGHMEILNTSLNFPAGYELQEALGPAFLRNNSYFNWKAEKSEDSTAIDMAEGVSCSQLTSDSQTDHLLDAVVSNICQRVSDGKSEQLPKPVQCLSTAEFNPEPSSYTTNTITSAGYSFQQSSLMGEDKEHGLSSSGICGAISATGISSNCASTCSEQLERSSEPSKKNRKRARPRESCRPRPRDRQLIQDRIEELRELVPNGSKCSIDSLLERTIKHMLFLQSITKHAGKLHKCANSKNLQLHDKQPGVAGSSIFEHGSSWAVEVAGHLKVCSIIVENLNKNGQMLVEMLCEDCSHFLEIAEAIRSLGLTILKGVTEANGDKTWICFVVEGQSNWSIHRMEILWSLVKILESEKPQVQQ